MELRQTDRISLVYYLKVFDGLGNKILGHVVNISDKGLQLLCDDAVEPNEDYRLRLRLPPFMQESQELVFRGTSRWCREDESSGYYLVGFQLRDLEPRTKKIFKRLMTELGRRDS